MWWKEYEDMRPDDPLLQAQVEPGEGIVGCEMHGLYGWGERYSLPSHYTAPLKRRGLFFYLHTLFTSKYTIKD